MATRDSLLRLDLRPSACQIVHLQTQPACGFWCSFRSLEPAHEGEVPCVGILARLNIRFATKQMCIEITSCLDIRPLNCWVIPVKRLCVGIEGPPKIIVIEYITIGDLLEVHDTGNDEDEPDMVVDLQRNGVFVTIA
ncbi:hypothetical protein [Ktedonospora formicarum]|uniref:hypothetical protein n=1 Tax=Ktedonospora formicarum TaxID=2778364 RepID=UPI001C692129|nr:hypothetical protein [Ktedonospora formicarum]